MSPGAARAQAARDAGPEDVAAVVDLVESAYRGERSRAGWTTEADLLAGQRTDADEVAAAVAAPGSIVLVTGAPLVACCRIADVGDGLALLGMLSVAPGTQAAGHGRAMLHAGERRAAAAWGASAVEMTVIVQRTALIAWYARRGYVDTGERRPFPYGDERFGVPLRDDLEFAVLRRELG